MVDSTQCPPFLIPITTPFRFYRYVEPQHKTSKPNSLSGSAAGTAPSATAAPPPQPPKQSIYTRNPIITVTEHTPTPSPDYLKRQGSIDSQLDVLSQMGCYGKVSMLRSHTDSHIAYTGADEIEAPGSSFYITPDGGIDYEILLLVSNTCEGLLYFRFLNLSVLSLGGLLSLQEGLEHLFTPRSRNRFEHLRTPS